MGLTVNWSKTCTRKSADLRCSWQLGSGIKISACATRGQQWSIGQPSRRWHAWMLLLTGAAALDCHADFWPEMHASPRRLEALILANGALVKLCFDADADGAVHRQHARAFLKAAGLVDVTVAGGLEDVLQRNDAVEAIVEVLFAAKQRRRSPAFSRRASASRILIRCSSRPGRRCGRTSRLTSCP